VPSSAVRRLVWLLRRALLLHPCHYLFVLLTASLHSLSSSLLSLPLPTCTAASHLPQLPELRTLRLHDYRRIYLAGEKSRLLQAWKGAKPLEHGSWLAFVRLLGSPSQHEPTPVHVTAHHRG